MSDDHRGRIHQWGTNILSDDRTIELILKLDSTQALLAASQQAGSDSTYLTIHGSDKQGNQSEAAANTGGSVTISHEGTSQPHAKVSQPWQANRTLPNFTMPAYPSPILAQMAQQLTQAQQIQNQMMQIGQMEMQFKAMKLGMGPVMAPPVPAPYAAPSMSNPPPRP